MRQVSKCILGICAFATVTGQTSAQPATTYPTRRTVAFAYAVAPANREPLFQQLATMVTLETKTHAAVIAAYLIKNADDSDTTVCGEAIVGLHQKFSAFVITKPKTYVDVTEEGWKALGCSTSGGLLLEWRQRLDGKEGMEIR